MTTSGTSDASNTPSSATPPVRRLTSEELFSGARVICISHAGQDYRLQVTINDRLILTK